METFEESQDFDIPGEDDVPLSGYEIMDDEQPIIEQPSEASAVPDGVPSDVPTPEEDVSEGDEHSA
jgi:hypothetical protein